MSDLDKRTVWSGLHRGVRFKVSLHGEGREYRPMGTWCYYITVLESQLLPGWLEKFDLPPQKDDRGRVHYNYMSAWFADLDWHGGITYYEKHGGIDGTKKAFEMGCDYAHFWDEDYRYSLEQVASDARRTVDELLAQAPLLVHCAWCGAYADSALMQTWGSSMIERSCIEKRNAAFPEAAPIIVETL